MSASKYLLHVSDGFEGQSWNILDQTYVPKHKDEHSFSWHATFPDGSFVPMHSHPTQDEFIYILEGGLDLVCDGSEFNAGPGDYVTLPKGISHSIHNRSGGQTKCLFTVSPTRMLYDYFQKIDGVLDRDVLAQLAAEHEVPFVTPASA